MLVLGRDPELEITLVRQDAIVSGIRNRHREEANVRNVIAVVFGMIQFALGGTPHSL